MNEFYTLGHKKWYFWLVHPPKRLKIKQRHCFLRTLIETVIINLIRCSLIFKCPAAIFHRFLSVARISWLDLCLIGPKIGGFSSFNSEPSEPNLDLGQNL